MLKRKPKYYIKRGFMAPVAGGSGRPVYEIWRRKTLFRREEHLDTFIRRKAAQNVCDTLNGKK